LTANLTSSRFRAAAAVFAAIVVMAIVFVGRSQAAGGVTVSKFDVAFTLFNPCTDELVDLSGKAQTVLDVSPDDGHFHFQAHDIALKGIGQTTGTRYVEHANISIVIEGPFENGHFVEQNTIRNLRLITAGGGNNFVDFAVTYHITVNANGDVAVEFVHALPTGCG
jgi:hypothetical protein